MERRQHERSGGLKAAVVFSWKDSEHISRRHKGRLLNISGGGVFVATCGLPPVGARIRLSVSFRTIFADTRLAIRASAEVIRVELAQEAKEVAGCTGFAAAISSFTLHTHEKNLIFSGIANKNSKKPLM
jgi:hypothetical protein